MYTLRVQNPNRRGLVNQEPGRGITNKIEDQYGESVNIGASITKSGVMA